MARQLPPRCQLQPLRFRLRMSAQQMGRAAPASLWHPLQPCSPASSVYPCLCCCCCCEKQHRLALLQPSPLLLGQRMGQPDAAQWQESRQQRQAGRLFDPAYSGSAGIADRVGSSGTIFLHTTHRHITTE